MVWHSAYHFNRTLGIDFKAHSLASQALHCNMLHACSLKQGTQHHLTWSHSCPMAQQVRTRQAGSDHPAVAVACQGSRCKLKAFVRQAGMQETIHASHCPQ